MPADPRFIEILAADSDLTVHGTLYRPPWFTYQPEAPAGCRVRRYDPRKLTSRGQLHWIYPGLVRNLRLDKPDLVHVIGEPWGIITQQVTRYVKRARAAMVIHGCEMNWGHGSFLESRVRLALARRAVSRASAYVAENQRAIDQALSHGLSPTAPTSVSHTNPRDPDMFVPGDRVAARAALGLPDGQSMVGFIGEMREDKGPRLLLDAMQMLRSEGKQIQAVMAGRGPLAEEIEILCRQQGDHFLGGLEYPGQVVEFYRAVDVVAVPSYATESIEEQSPRVIVEAMLSGKKVVAARTGSIPDMVGDTGIVFGQGDVQGLARAISSFLDEEQPELGQRARERAIELFSAESSARRISVLWDQVLNNVAAHPMEK